MILRFPKNVGRPGLDETVNRCRRLIGQNVLLVIDNKFLVNTLEIVVATNLPFNLSEQRHFLEEPSRARRVRKCNVRKLLQVTSNLSIGRTNLHTYAYIQEESYSSCRRS